MKQTTQFHAPPHSINRLTFDLQRFSAFSGGDGSKNNPYQIKTVADLQQLASDVNSGNDYIDTYFKLMDNIDLSGINWTPIGNSSSQFSGTFDGNDKTISNLTITGGGDFSGLFGKNYGTIQNVNLLNATVEGNYWVGGIVGKNYCGIVDKCTFTGSVKGNNWVGGIVGQNQVGIVYKCTFTDSVEGNSWVGGIVGQNNRSPDAEGIVADCNFVGGTVEATSSYGNIVGQNNGRIEDHLYRLTLPQGVIATGDKVFTVNGKTYAVGDVTLAGKTGYIFSATANVSEDMTINGTATFDTTNHYAFSDGNGYTLATADNTKDYPDLVQVYKLTLPENVTATGSIVITDGGTIYAAGNVKLNAPEGYTLDKVTVDGVTISGNTFKVSSDVEIAAEVTAIVTEDNEFNKAGTAVVVNGTTGDFSANSTLYSITASQQNSTLIANAKANQIIVAGGNENILTGGKGNDTFNFTAGGGIVTDFGIGATKGGDGKTLTTASGTDIVKVDGTVKKIYFERDASSKKSATFTATIVYTDDNNADQVIVLKDIAKKPTKTNSNPSKAIYQTNDVAAATLKIWDTSSGKQSVLSSTKLKKFFCDDDNLTGDLKTQADDLSALVDGNNLVSTNDDILQSSTTNNGTTYIFPANGGIGGIGTGSNNPKP